MASVQKYAALLATLLLTAPLLTVAVSYRKMVMGNSATSVGDNSVQSGAYSYEDGALYMSDFITKGDTEGLRAAAAVDPSLFLGYTSYAGYITVNQTTNANTFLWYVSIVRRYADVSQPNQHYELQVFPFHQQRTFCSSHRLAARRPWCI
jgi:hypothetical protein